MLIALPHSQWSSTAPLVYGALSAPPVEKAEPSEKKSCDSMHTLSSSMDQTSASAGSPFGEWMASAPS